jgi:hypothetical protein
MKNIINLILNRLLTPKLTIFIVLISNFLLLNIYKIQAQNPPYLYVSSRNTNSVKYFDAETGNYIGDFVVPNSGGLNATQEVIFGPNGNLLVTGRGNSHILEYDRHAGNYLGNFSSGYDLDEPTKMTFKPDSLLYISQWGMQKNKVARFNAYTGEFVDEFTSIGLNEASGHAWDAAGNLYVACYGSKDVRRFDTSGNYLGVFTENGYLQGPVNLWFDNEGDLFVLDWTLGAVLRFDGQSGNFLSTFISGMQNSEGFTFGVDSLIYICDWSLNRINRYDSVGNFVDIFTSDGSMMQPNSLVFGPPENPNSINSNDTKIPQKFELWQNYPNPFNPETTIKYSLPSRSKVVLKIYDIPGKEIRILVDDIESSGEKSTVWDGRNDQGREVASGIYIYRLQAGNKMRINKMILLK